jgi:GT2 family glycosyltransferase
LPDGAPSRPGLSVIVPTCNRDRSLARCLAALAAQTLSGADFEVIVVDDSGNPETGQTLPENLEVARLQLLRHDRNRGAAAARNTGARAASEPFLVFVDDDCVPESDWAAQLAMLLPTVSGAALVGAVRVADPQPVADRVTQLLSDPMEAADGTLVRAQTANLTLPADGFEALGGFDESYRGAGYEDYDFCQRWRATGRRIVAAPQAVVHHQRNTTLAGFWRQHYRYGLGAAQFYGPGAHAPRPPLKASFRRVLQAVGAGRTLPERLGHLGWVGLSQCAMLVGFATGRIFRS